MRTTQAGFNPVLGHLVDGTQIRMDNGDLVQINRTDSGWALHVLTPTGPKFHANAGRSAHVVECLVYVYPSTDI